MELPVETNYSPYFFEKLTPELARLVPQFDSRQFIFGIFDRYWADLSMIEKRRSICKELRKQLPPHFPDSISILQSVDRWMRSNSNFSPLNFIPDYVVEYGMNHPGESMIILHDSRNRKDVPEEKFSLSPAVGFY